MSPPPIALWRKSQLTMETIRSGETSNYTINVAFEVRSQPGLIGSKIEGDTGLQMRSLVLVY